MRIRLIVMLVLIVVCGNCDFLRAADNDPKSISIDAESHQLEKKQAFEKSFSASANRTEYALLFEQKLEQQSSARYWRVEINDTVLGRLEAHLPQADSAGSDDEFYRIGLAIPTGVLKGGENRLAIGGQGQPAVVRNFTLERRSLKQALQLGTVTVKVSTGEDKRPLPARITVVDTQGRLAKLYDVRTPTNAVRPGILYTLGAGDSFSLPAGDYTLYATRGMEWGVAKQQISVESGQPQIQALTISREVDTTGFVACDSHIHTLPGSGHGNATYAERMITIAGEGIEVAVATDHNHISVYDQLQITTGTHDHFQAISGDEVTTHNGHFTAFPLDPANAVPGGVQGRNPLFLEVEDWAQLIADMRDKGAKVVILNHPYWPTIPEGPFGRFQFDRQTASRRTGSEFSFDGIEVAQPANMTPNLFYALDDWLTLLNRGTRLTAVGASDSHTVNDPVGQARTYLESHTDNIADIDRDEVCRAFVEGRASVASGIFARLSIAQKYSMGDLVPASIFAAADGQTASFNVRLRVAAPSWVRPLEAMIYVNGRRVAEQLINAQSDQPTNQTLEFTIEVPPHDAHVVAFVLGEDIKLPGWTTYGKATQAITNPIYLDIDDDGKYSAPRETARKLIANEAGNGAKLSQSQQAALLDKKEVQADLAVLLHIKDLLKQGAEKN